MARLRSCAGRDASVSFRRDIGNGEHAQVVIGERILSRSPGRAWLTSHRQRLPKAATKDESAHASLNRHSTAAEIRMPRASWKGFLRLSLVSCPVYLSPGTTRTKSVRLRQVWVPGASSSEEREEHEQWPHPRSATLPVAAGGKIAACSSPGQYVGEIVGSSICPAVSR